MSELNDILASLDCNKGKEPFKTPEEKFAAINDLLKDIKWSPELANWDSWRPEMDKFAEMLGLPKEFLLSEAEVKLLCDRKAKRDGRLYVRLWRRFMEWVRA